MTTLTGGCFCGAIRYRATGNPVLQAQCHCRACTHVSGGGPNYFMLMPPEGFTYTEGTPKSFTRPDSDRTVTRDFCGTCGTHLTTRRPGLREIVLKVGTLDEPSGFSPRIAIFTGEKQPYHQIPEGLHCFDTLPPR